MVPKDTQSLVRLARQLPPWTPLALDDAKRLQLINATVKSFEFDEHDKPEILISLEGQYAIETPSGEVSIPEGHMFVVTPGLRHRPANLEQCVLLVFKD